MHNKKDPHDLAYDEAIRFVTDNYPQVNIAKMRDLDRMLNWELWHGPLPDNYWTEVEPCDTPWHGFEAASKELESLLDPLPHEVWWEADFECITETDPDDDESNWEVDPEGEEPDVWIGGESWHKLNLRRILLHIETWKQVF